MFTRDEIEQAIREIQPSGAPPDYPDWVGYTGLILFFVVIPLASWLWSLYRDR